MRVELINWSGHKNLGDDAMAEVLLEAFPGSINMGENPTENANWYILGGGTLISPGSLYFARMPSPERTIGISLGVSSNWDGEGVEILKRMKRIYTRDHFSHNRLKFFGVENFLSVDLLCYLKPKLKKERTEIWANLMYSDCNTNPILQEEIDTIKRYLSDKEVNYFAMSPDEDLRTLSTAIVYNDANFLLEKLSNAKTIYATRLHAHVLAWLSGCKDIRSIEYDYKIRHFFERVKGLKPRETKLIIDKHLRQIKSLISE
jgi:polysaccharide pyruvyl transferase WcaK-like protein